MKYLIILFLLIPFISIAKTISTFNGVEYIVSDTVTLSWDASIDALYISSYEINSVWIDPSDTLQWITYPCGNTTLLQIILTQKRAGHHMFKVRSVDNRGITSEWAESTNKSYAAVKDELTGNYIPGAWRVYWMLPAPTDIIIE